MSSRGELFFLVNPIGSQVPDKLYISGKGSETTLAHSFYDVSL